MKSQLSEHDWQRLSRAAWQVRENAHILGRTKVGAAVIADNGEIYLGCNVEHRFRSHDVHAEVNAIASMVAAGRKHVVAILIAAERESFTPCGACMDWIMELGGPSCEVAFQGKPERTVEIWTANELMPHYPRAF